MANVFVFANLARSSLAGSLSNVATVLNVQAGAGAQFPNPSAGQQYALTLTDAATGLLKEVVYCTNRTGDTMTVIRAQEGYSALNWLPQDPIANLWTAGQAAAMLQQGQSQSQASNYSADSGTTNAYVGVYNPVVTSPVIGMPLRLKIANTNTAASTFNPGSGLAAIHDGAGNALGGGELVAGQISEFMWTGTAYELMAPAVLLNDDGPIVTVLTSADVSPFTPNGASLYMEVTWKGAGGGGAGGNAGPTNLPGSDGTDTIFDGIHAGGGKGAATVSAVIPGAGGVGGTGSATLRIPGQPGGPGSLQSSVGGWPSGSGGGSGGLPGRNTAGDGAAATADSGAGGTGAFTVDGGNFLAGPGGGEGETAILFVNNPTGTYAFTIGTGGAGGAGTNDGGAGADGYVMVKEYFH